MFKINLFDAIKDLISGVFRHIRKIIDTALGLDDDEIKGLIDKIEQKKVLYFRKKGQDITIITAYPPGFKLEEVA